MKHAAYGLALLLLALTACDKRDEPPPPAPKAASESEPAAQPEAGLHLPPGIAWFAGDVDAAFAAAKAASKPVFVYWGAEWCPPCAQIKSTIFSKREFQERSRLFVPVYLDGDTPRAQKHGEHFGVVGYPTMILFRPDGTEITRLPGGVDIARYATVLDAALAAARPVAEILAAAQSGATVADNDWRLLAFYSWGTDNGRIIPDEQNVATFRNVAARCPSTLPGECARLYFEYVAAAAAATKPGAPALDGLARADARRQVLALLAAPSVQKENVANLLYRSKEVIELLSEPASPERAQLTTAWRTALGRLDSAGSNSALSTPEQLMLIRAHVLLAHLEAPKAPLPPALLEEARHAVARMDASITDAYSRQASVNAAVGLYWEAGLDVEADRLLTAELEKSPSPYYFMLDLAESAQKAGRKEQAVQWLARAYQGAKGPATRFQWGYNYLVGLLEMTPGDVKGIEQAGLAVLGELDGAPDAFYQRTRIALEKLDGKLLEWGQEGAAAAVVETLRTRTGAICRKLPEGDAGRQNCERFLNPATQSAQAA